MSQYVWERSSWPQFSMDFELLLTPLGRCRYQQGILYHKLEQVGLELQLGAQLESLTTEAVETSAIEGEFLDPAGVRSSVARKLGLPTAGLPPASRGAEGLVEVLLDATAGFDQPLSEDRIKGWHAALFPTGYSGLHKIEVAGWRRAASDPMRVVSGPIGKERVHYVAPPAADVAREMKRYIDWWNRTILNGEGDPVLNAGVAHYYFLAIHPFEDGNGRVARALTDMVLARADGARKRCYSVSAGIMRDRENYYNVLDKTSLGNGDLTPWLIWFLGCLEQALLESHKTLDGVLGTARFWQRVAPMALNRRQIKVLAKLLDARAGGFEGGLKPHKYRSMTGVSRATAHRDITDLVEKGILVPGPAGGRSSSFDLNWDFTLAM